MGVLLAAMLRDAVGEKEYVEARSQAKSMILMQLGLTEPDVPTPAEAPPTAAHPDIVYDERGKPRPAHMAYDSTHNDVPEPAQDDEDVDDNPFPHLYPPLG